MILYNALYKKFGIRLLPQLLSPLVGTIQLFEFPRDSVYHYRGLDTNNNGPASDEFLFRNIEKRILINHVLELSSLDGNAKKQSISIEPYIKEYHRKNRRYRQLNDTLELTKDELTLVVNNYGFLTHSYRYTRQLLSNYHQWRNIDSTIWSTIAKQSKTSTRQHFVMLKLPNRLPSIATLNKFKEILNANVITIFDSSSALFLLELWKWIDPQTRASSTLSALDKEALDKTNLVYTDGPNFVILNLGLFNSWISKGEEGEKSTIDHVSIEKRLMGLLLNLTARRVMPDETDEVLDNEVSEVGDENNPIVTNGPIVINEEPLSSMDEPMVDIDAIDNPTEDDIAVNKNDSLDKLEEDLKQLELMESKTIVVEPDDKPYQENGQKVFKNKTIKIEDFEPALSIEESLKDKIAELADYGIMSAQEYKKLNTLADNTAKIPSPYFKGKTLNETAVVLQEELTVEAHQIPDSKTVLDKTMLKSTLIDFDEKYIKEVLPKDVSSMVVNMQKTGIIITDYNVEKITDYLGDFEIHQIKLKPVQGQASTIRYKLPVIDDEGKFTSNGNKYKMRKQMSDCPIRKVNPNTVALTSYYGKTFVQRSNKKVNDYAAWLVGVITAKALDPLDKDVSQLVPGDLFDNHFKSPRIYSILSRNFKTFNSGRFTFFFDHKERTTRIEASIVKKYETQGSVFFATSTQNTYLLINKDNLIYELVNEELVLKGSIENVLNINPMGCPVDFTEIKILGKYIPVGVVLAYQLGLQKLMDLLKVSPRRVLAGQRTNLQANEYTLVFSDETLIFDKNDVLPTLVLAGFNEYHRGIKTYSVYSFDKPNVYLNILEGSGIGARYLREIDLMLDLFVDPITKGLLLELKEPTTYRGLLIRSTELLTTDQHPDLLDMQYMRIKGYERIAGAVYNELVQSARQFKSKGGRANEKIEMNPYAVWKRIAQDPSVKILEEINPINDIKQQEAVTFSGEGGRNSRSMTKITRGYHPSHMGVISESTVDSGDVAINTYLSGNPKFNSLRGTANAYDFGKDGGTSLLSTSALAAPAAVRDD
jgi:hypothetical protein